MKILKNIFRKISTKKREKGEQLKLDYNNTRDYNSNVLNIVNTKKYSSPTKFLIYVDLNNFRVNILKGSSKKWTLDKSYLCTIGKNSTPTPKGVFSVGVKGLYFGVNKGYKCWYYTSFKGNYLFHSILYNLDGSVKDGRLGMRLSDGCIRLTKENAKYLWDNVPAKTKVIIV